MKLILNDHFITNDCYYLPHYTSAGRTELFRAPPPPLK